FSTKFVENSIWHGLAPKEGKGHIIIRFFQNEKELVCEVDDDGVGRKKSLKTPKKYESKALKITHRRLQLIRERTRKPASLEIIDLTGQEGGATGTKVIIRLPIVD
ncbi:MAG: sensor protein lytS, partial [Bacteroidota bacterium]